MGRQQPRGAEPMGGAPCKRNTEEQPTTILKVRDGDGNLPRSRKLRGHDQTYACHIVRADDRHHKTSTPSTSTRYLLSRCPPQPATHPDNTRCRALPYCCL